MWKPELLAEWARVYPATRELYLSYCEDHAFSNAFLRDVAVFPKLDELFLPNLHWHGVYDETQFEKILLEVGVTNLYVEKLVLSLANSSSVGRRAHTTQSKSVSSDA